METKFPGEMKAIYKMYSLKKSSDGPGGKFNGPKVKHLMSEKVLEEMESLLTPEGAPFINYLRAIREVHRVSISSDFNELDWKCSLFNFEENFFFLYNVYQLNMTLKIHIIIHHYSFYFSATGKNFKDTNGEFGETCHSTLKKFEKQKGFYRAKNFSSDDALIQAHQSHSTSIAMKMGSPARSLGLKRPSSRSSSPGSSPRSSPSKPRWKRKESLVQKYLSVQKSF